jgi:hypothetical protein
MGSVDDIRAADVLLFHGDGFVAWAIRAFDGTEVNHAAIALDQQLLGEAAGDGLRAAGIAAAVRQSRLTVVRSLPAAPDPAPVVGCARRYLDTGAAYAYQQIVLLAFLSLTRRVPMPLVARRLLREVLDRGAAALNALVDSGRRLMICSEFVYRCYDEAYDGPAPDPYALEISPRRALRLDRDTLLDWALAQPDSELPEPSAVRVLGAPVDPETADELAEAALAPLIAAYAVEAGLDADLPPLPTDLGFRPLPAEVPDGQLLAAVVRFSAALRDASAAFRDASGGVFPEAPGGARDALEAVRALAVDPNFVTPGDLLRAPSLTDRVRLAGG